MLISAISHISKNVHTERDFWREHDIKKQDIVLSSASKIKKEFNSKRQINRDEEKENRTGWSQENHPAR